MKLLSCNCQSHTTKNISTLFHLFLCIHKVDHTDSEDAPQPLSSGAPHCGECRGRVWVVTGPGGVLRAQRQGQPRPAKNSVHCTNSVGPPSPEKSAKPGSFRVRLSFLPLNKLDQVKRRNFKMTTTTHSELYRLVTFILNPHLWKNGFFPLKHAGGNFIKQQNLPGGGVTLLVH